MAILFSDFTVHAGSVCNRAATGSHFLLLADSTGCLFQEFVMALVLLLRPSRATSCYRSAPTRLLTQRSLQGVGCASKHSDLKRHGRHTNIGKQAHAELSLSSEQQADISLLITVPACVFVCRLCGFVCVCVCNGSCLWDMLCWP